MPKTPAERALSGPPSTRARLEETKMASIKTLTLGLALLATPILLLGPAPARA